jgi:hypothetical protein
MAEFGSKVATSLPLVIALLRALSQPVMEMVDVGRAIGRRIVAVIVVGE